MVRKQRDGCSHAPFPNEKFLLSLADFGWNYRKNLQSREMQLSNEDSKERPAEQFGMLLE